MVSNWLITGGCGFIGSSLIKKILTINPEVNFRVLDNLSVGSREDLAEICCFKEVLPQDISTSPKGGELIVGDIRDAHVCRQVTKGVDVVVHLAANTGVGPSVEDPRLDCVTNVIGTLNMLEASRERDVSRFVFASSGAPIGECEPPIHEELAAHPVSPYGASKLAGEGYCSAYFRTFDVETVALRFGNVYGPRSEKKSSVVAKFIKLLVAGDVMEVYGDGSQTRDFIYIDDLVEAIELAARVAGIGGEVFQIATSQETTVKEIAGKLVHKLGCLGVGDVKLEYSNPRLGDVKRNFSDISKASNILGWTAKTSLDDGLQQTIRYFLSLYGR